MRRVALALCCALVMGACGDDDATARPASTTVAATATPATTAPATTSRPGVVPIDTPPCDLITPEEVAAATGFTVEAGREAPPLACRYDLSDAAGVHVAVILDDGRGRMGGAAAIYAGYQELVGEGGAEEVPGLGVAAIYSQSFRGLAVDAGGGRYLVFAVGGGYQALEEPKAELVAIASAALARL